MMISCFQGHTNSTAEKLNFVHCVVGSTYPQNAGPTCSAGTSVAWETVNTCMHAWEGEALELAAGQATDALNPPHQYVPWPTLDGNFCDDCISDLLPKFAEPTPVPTNPLPVITDATRIKPFFKIIGNT